MVVRFARPHWRFMLGAVLLLPLMTAAQQVQPYLFKLAIDGPIDPQLGAGFPVASETILALLRLAGIFHNQKTDWISEGTQHNRNCWHNLKYYTWVEQQGKTVEELDAQRDPEYWLEKQAAIEETDKLILEYRG